MWTIPGPACTCGHLLAPHEHLRRGRECAFCLCPQFRRKRWWRKWDPRPVRLAR